MARLTGKVAVITGGAGGIGRAAGKLFAEEGAKVLLVDLQAAALEDAVKDTGSRDVSYVTADTTQPDEVERFVNTAVERYGGIDVFLANAGIEGQIHTIPDYPVEVFDRVIAVNVRGVWLGLKYVIPVMRERGGGSIVITSSTAGIHGSPDALAVRHQQARRDRDDAQCRERVRAVGHPGEHRQPVAHRDADDAVAGADARRGRPRRSDT